LFIGVDGLAPVLPSIAQAAPVFASMPSVHRPISRALSAAALLTLCAAAAALWASSSTPARAASASSLQNQISAGQNQINGLSSRVKVASGHLAQLGSALAGMERQLAGIQRNLDAKRAELLALRVKLSAAQNRLGILEAAQAHDETVLARRLVSSYETAKPDLVDVVLEATGFQNLLDRIAFARRIQNQDTRVVSQVRAARRATAAQATRLGALNARQQAITEEILVQRNRLARVELSLQQQQSAAAQKRSAVASELARVRDHVASLQHQLAALQPPAPSVGSNVAAGQIVSSGGFTFPMPKGDASPPGTWSPDQGVDISAPGDTPELAVCAGTIVLHGIGGFGPWAPVLHCDNPLDGHSYVYYGHAGPANQLAIGTHVNAGQVMSSVGPGIVGISTGPHLEIGFCDSSGAPIGSQTAGAMMSLLQASY
jgi:murein DD-endopeptidase MepM/ murein hydrolase activator NlpD